MLTSLTIQNVVLIERLTLEFAGGLCVLTGETGAGKSILLDALGLATGARAESGLVRNGANQASVTAVFDLNVDDPVFTNIAEILVEQGIEPEVPLILRRVLSADGRSRAFINDQPVSAGNLRHIGGRLLEVHGQFQTLGLLDPRHHLSLLDAFAGLGKEAAKVRAAYELWHTLEKEHLARQQQHEKTLAEIDYLRTALEDIDALDPRTDEEDELDSRRQYLMNAEKILESLNIVMAEIDGAESSLGTAGRTLDRIFAVAGDQLVTVSSALDRAVAELSEASSDLHRLAEETELNPAELEAVDERLFALKSLARKHNTEISDLPQVRRDLAARLESIDSETDALGALARKAEAAKGQYLEIAGELSEKRAQAANMLDAAVAVELGPLKLDKARFVTRIQPRDEDGYDADGLDDVAFLIATNPGAEPGPLAKIASGGELARFMLALKVVLAEADPVPVLVFDEVDAGIGGAVADAVGERLARLAAGVQILVVTHSPQVAARAAHHWRVEKRSDADTALTNVVGLDPTARHEEIARMLSGAEITDEARAAAARLLEIN